ncbi:hypothetical protein BBD32_10065 [Elizabethkingia anophelis]|uniref:Uncharacterized protein n=2 Tax=Elizabethkingia anophelis TaxID=1117645 RepID=A0AAU8UUS8_9FLAO|nr:hypothetical protein BBD32_10065 [Elizabethkingia anophelis]OPB63079.1 hypothetical protein BAY11_03950 [Elizabethkingia anophelis]
MYKKIALLFTFIQLFGQHTIHFREADSNLPVKYCEIKINHHVFFSDSLGKLTMKTSKAFEIIDSRYQSMSVRATSKDSVIILHPKEHIIPEVTISSLKTLNFEDRIRRNSIYNLSTGYSYGKVLKTNFQNNAQLKSITLYPKRKITNSYYIKLDFYEFSPGFRLILKEKLNTNNIIIPFSDLSAQKEKLYIDLRRFNIRLKDPDLFISIRIIADIGIYQDEKINDIILSLYASKIKEDIYIGNYYNGSNKEIWNKHNISSSDPVAIDFSVLQSN